MFEQLMDTVYLDLETTGLSPERGDEIVQIAILRDPTNEPILYTKVRPTHNDQWPHAQRIHGISPDDVRDAPTLDDIRPQIVDALTGKKLVIYNRKFDYRFIPEECAQAMHIACCMVAFANWINGAGNGRNYKLEVAADHIGYEIGETAHDALADTRATRAIWRHLWKERMQRPRTGDPSHGEPPTARGPTSR